MATTTLIALIEDLDAGRLSIVDLTQPLGPATPVIALPPVIASSPGVTIDVISQYDERGPAWYWNALRMGEDTGTHLDAPVHWITARTCRTMRATRSRPGFSWGLRA